MNAVGIIEDLAADLEALLYAARNEFPPRAAQASEAAGEVATAIGTLNEESALAGDPQVLRDALRLCGDAYDGLVVLVQSLNYCSQGLIDVVETYRLSDAEAGEAFNRINTSITEGPAPAQAEVPADIGEPESTGSSAYPVLIPSTRQPRDPDEVLEEINGEIPSVELPQVPS